MADITGPPGPREPDPDRAAEEPRPGGDEAGVERSSYEEWPPDDSAWLTTTPPEDAPPESEPVHALPWMLYDDVEPEGAWMGTDAGAALAARNAPTWDSRRPLWTIISVAAVSALIGAIVGGAMVLLGTDEPAAAPPERIIERIETRVEVDRDRVVTSAAEVARRVLPAIVTVERGLAGEDGFVRTGGGSGVVIDIDGHIVTNHHVIDGAEQVRVVFTDGRIFPAVVLGSDAVTDVAVLFVERDGLTPIVFGSTTDLSVGDAASAIGNPLTLEGGPSVTAGVISALNRRVLIQGGGDLFGMVQTDAPITRGSSGGALVDGEGRLIGITTAVAVSDLGSESLGFAVPVEVVVRVTADIIARGSTTHAFLGISGRTHYITNPDDSIQPAGVEIEEIIEGTAAEAAGILAGDLIVSYEGIPITTMEELVILLRFDRVGDVVSIGVVRDGEEITLDVELMERPEGV
jgi:putative serine protease PepD